MEPEALRDIGPVNLQAPGERPGSQIRGLIDALQEHPCYIHPIPEAFNQSPTGTFVVRRASNYNEKTNQFFYTLEYRGEGNKKRAVKFEVTDKGYSFVLVTGNKQILSKNVSELLKNIMESEKTEFSIPLKTFLEIHPPRSLNQDPTSITNDLKSQLIRLGNPVDVTGFSVYPNPKNPLSFTLIMVTTVKVDDSSRAVEVKENYEYDFARGGFVSGNNQKVYASLADIMGSHGLSSACTLEDLKKSIDLAQMQKLLIPCKAQPHQEKENIPPPGLMGRIQPPNQPPHHILPLPHPLPPGVPALEKPEQGPLVLDRNLLKELGFFYTERDVRQSTYQAASPGTLLVWESLSQKGKLVVMQKLAGVALEEAPLQLLTMDGTLMERLKNFDMSVPAGTATTEEERRSQSQLAMERASGLTNEQKVNRLDSLITIVNQNKKSYNPTDFNNILKTLEAGKHLIQHAKSWELFADKIQKNQVTTEQISDEIYNKLKIIAHPDINDEAPLLRTFGHSLVSGCLAAKAMGQLDEFLKYAVSAEDICLEARERSVSSWIQNNVISSVPIEFDPNKDDHYKAVGSCIEAFKERQLRTFYNQFYKQEFEGGGRAGYGEKMLFGTDTWKAYKAQMELDPRFYEQFYNRKSFVDFFNKEYPKGLNLKVEEGNKYNHLSLDNILEAIESLSESTGIDSFSLTERSDHLMYFSQTLSKKLTGLTGPDFRIENGNKYPFRINVNNRSPQEFEILPGGGIKTDKPGTHGILQLYYPTIQDFFKSLNLKPPE